MAIWGFPACAVPCGLLFLLLYSTLLLTRWLSLGSIRSEKKVLMLITSPLQPLYLFLLPFFFFFFHKQHFFYPSLWPAVKAVIPTAVSAAGNLAVLLHVLQWQARCRFAGFSTIFPNKTCTRKLWWGSGDRPEQGGVPGTRLWLPHRVEDDPVPWFQIFPWKFFQGRLGSTARLSDQVAFK